MCFLRSPRFHQFKANIIICRWSFKASAYIIIRVCYLGFSILTFKRICCIASTISQFFIAKIKFMMTMMITMMMNCFCGIVDRRKAIRLISSRDHIVRDYTITDLRHTMNRNWTCTEPEFSFLEWSCTVVLTTVNRTMTFQM